MKNYVLMTVLLALLSGCFKTLQDEKSSLKEITVMVNTLQRKCCLYCPAKTVSAKAPLFIVLHGAGGTPRGLVRLTRPRFNELSDVHGFYAAYPEGTRRTWNDSRNDSSTCASRNRIDDVGFISALIDQLTRDYPIDVDRVCVVGISNGGSMAFRLACELSRKISGIAIIAATNPAGQR